MDRERTKCNNQAQRLFWWVLRFNWGWWFQCLCRLGEEPSDQKSKHLLLKFFGTIISILQSNVSELKDGSHLKCDLKFCVGEACGCGGMHRHLCAGFRLLDYVSQEPWFPPPSGGGGGVFRRLCYLWYSSSRCYKHQRSFSPSSGNLVEDGTEFDLTCLLEIYILLKTFRNHNIVHVLMILFG